MKIVKKSIFPIMLALLLCACGRTAEHRTISDVNNLDGCRIGVNLAWEADYMLTGRKDLELCRYDSTADMLMALDHGKIDGIAIDDSTLKIVLKQVGGVEIVEPALGEIGYTVYFAPDEEELLKDFNAFLAEWKASGDYENYIRHIHEFDGENYQSYELPPDGTGKTLRFAYNMDGFPRSFWDPATDEAMGYDVEVVKLWAADRGYQLDCTATSYTDMEKGTLIGRYQLCTGYTSDVYNIDARAAGILVSDSFGEESVHIAQMAGDTINMDQYDFD